MKRTLQLPVLPFTSLSSLFFTHFSLFLGMKCHVCQGVDQRQIDSETTQLTLIHRAYKLNNTREGFHNDLKELTTILQRNLLPLNLIDRTIKKYLNNKKNISAQQSL